MPLPPRDPHDGQADAGRSADGPNSSPISAGRAAAVVRGQPLQAPLDFVILGAEKAGSTYLARALGDHPLVALPREEVRYFRDPFYGPPAELHAMLPPPAPGVLRGIKHPGYLARPEVPPRLAAHNPGLKLLASLRDPIDRCLSAYLHYVRAGQLPPLPPEEGLRVALDSPTRSPKYADVLAFGLYAKHLHRFTRSFPRESLLVLEFERLKEEHEVLGQAFRFLGVEPLQEPRRGVENGGTYDWGSCVESHHRSRLTRGYDDDDNLIQTPWWRRPPWRPRVAVETLVRMRASRRDRSGTTVLSSALRARLHEHYRGDQEDLVRSGFLVPRSWASLST